jgi:hypothetical protein
MMVSSRLGFRYSAQYRESIATAAPSVFSEADWHALEQLAALCPTPVIPNKKLAAIEKASKSSLDCWHQLRPHRIVTVSGRPESPRF